ncbi:nuclear pore complex protein NUP62-like [Prunus persica]|uniref:nuclear pore complex protein NUP62-like n=1 Tax=Prunus persica TaxID=3760 RepID=UPI0009AB8936|nr:nuclear pore complex protein NUP62-like [Prunus persica]
MSGFPFGSSSSASSQFTPLPLTKPPVISPATSTGFSWSSAPAFGSSSPSSAAAHSFGFRSSAATSAPSSWFCSSASTVSASSSPLIGSASASASSRFSSISFTLSAPSSLFSSSTVSSTPLFSSASSSSASTTPSFPRFSFQPASRLSKPTTSTPITVTPPATASSFSCAPSTSFGSQPSFVFSDTASSPAPISFAKPTSQSFSTRSVPLFSTVTTTSVSSTPAASTTTKASFSMPRFGATPTTRFLRKKQTPVAAMTTTQTSTSLVESSTSGTTSTVSTKISTAPKLPSEITGKTVEEAPLTSFKHETSYPITTSGPSATSDCSKLVEQSTLAAEVQTSNAISPVQPSSLDFDALDLETQLALICGGSSSSGFTPSVNAEQAISRIKLWQAKDFAVEEGHQSVGELINNLQILAEENLIPKSIFSSGVTSAQEFQQAADLWGTIHTSFEQAITCRNVYKRSTENLEKDRSQCFAQDFELQYLKNEAQEVEAEIAKLQTQLKAIKTKEKEVRIKLQRNLRDAWELQKQITTAQPGLEESHALILRGSKLRADMDAKFRVLKVILTGILLNCPLNLYVMLNLHPDLFF